MKKKIKVSICCITYNQEKYIGKALESFVHQKVSFPYEIIIHDDASTDGTRDIIQKYKEKYPDLIVPIFEEENVYSKKASLVMEIVFAKVRGEYIALCDGDDGFLSDEKLSKQVDYMDAHPEITMCSHNTRVISEDGNFMYDMNPYKEGIVTIEDYFKNTSGSMHTSSMFFRSRDVKSLPTYYREATVGDLPFKLYLLSKGNAYYIDEVMSFYRHNAKGSWTSFEKEDSKVLKKNRLMEIRVYELFNKETNNKYAYLVDEKIRTKKFAYYLKDNNLKELKKEEYKDLYNKLSSGEKIKLQLKNLPWLYDIYTKIKYRK